MNEKVKLKVEYVKLEELIPFELNARTHSKEQVGQIVNSIGEFDFVNPILVGVDNMIIAGHGRLMAAKKAGLETVPIIRLPHLDYNQCMALSLADNKIADNAGWDEEKSLKSSENLRMRISTLIFWAFPTKSLKIIGMNLRPTMKNLNLKTKSLISWKNRLPGGGMFGF